MMYLLHHSKAILPVFTSLVMVFNLPSSSLSQTTPTIDSLLSELTKAKDDTNKVKLLYRIGSEYNGINADEGLSMATQALELAEKLGWKRGIALSKTGIGRSHWRKGNFDEALNYHFTAMKLWQEINDKGRIATLKGFIGQDYADSGNYNEALKHLSEALKQAEDLSNKSMQKYLHSIFSWIYQNMGMEAESISHQYASLKLAEEVGDRLGAAIAYSNIASNYAEQGKYEEAIKTHQECLKIYLEFDDFINASNAYIYIGDCFESLGKHQEALSNHFKALELGKKINNGNSKGIAYSYIGSIYQVLGKNADALANFKLSVKEYGSVENKHALATLYSKIGNCLTRMGKYGEAQDYFDNALSLNNEIKSTGEFKNYYKGLTQLDSATGKWKNAFDHYKSFISARDSMYNEETTRRTVKTRMQYEFDKKEAETKAEQDKKDALANQELQRQKLMRNGFMGGFAAVLVFAGVFFNQRNTIKKEKNRSEELLLNILPSEVADELKEKGSADAKLIDEVTVLFSDFKDFTHMSEIQTPKDLVAEINECFSAFDRIMQKHGVEKIKTVGDAYLAAGGLPIPNATHAVDVLNAALEMQVFMQERKRQREAEGGFFFEARIGVHTGPVVAGIVGVKKFAYDIWGDTVNTAQRMESASDAGRINISESTYKLVKNQFSCTYRGKVETKGKGEVDMYFVEKQALGNS